MSAAAPTPNADQIKPAAVDKFVNYVKKVAEHVEETEGISFDTINPPLTNPTRITGRPLSVATACPTVEARKVRTQAPRCSPRC